MPGDRAGSRDHGGPPPDEATRAGALLSAATWERGAWWLGLLGVLIVTAKLHAGAWTFWDLKLWDGAWYYHWAGDLVLRQRPPTFENAPVYCAFYGVFQLFTADPFTAFFWHRVVTFALIGVLAYGLFSRLFGSVWALPASTYLLVLVSAEGVEAYTVRPFVLVPLLLAGHVALTRWPWRDALVVLAFLLAAGVRPELIYVVPLLLGFLALINHRQHGSIFPEGSGRPVVVVTMVTAALALFLLVASATRPGDRSRLAFGQHYGAGVAAREGASLGNPWVRWPDYLRASFGGVVSPGRALVANPRAFLDHVAWNAQALPRKIDLALRPTHLLSRQQRRWSTWWPTVVSGVALALGLGSARWLEVSLAKWLRDHARVLGVVSVATVDAVLAGLVISPQTYYLQAVRLALIGLAVSPLCLWTRRFVHGRVLAVATLAAVTVCAVFMPTPFFVDPLRQRSVLPIVRFVQSFEAQSGSAPYGLISNDARIYCYYARGTRCQPVQLLWRSSLSTEPESYLASNHVRVIVVDAALFREALPEWRRYLQQAELSGWQLGPTVPGQFVLYR